MVAELLEAYRLTGGFAAALYVVPEGGHPEVRARAGAGPDPPRHALDAASVSYTHLTLPTTPYV